MSKKITTKPKVKNTAKTRTKNYTPQQIDFAMRYYLPNSPTYGNALQSAIKAGFSEKYAKTITTMGLDWMEKILLEIIGKPEDKDNLVAKAKKVLSRSLDSPDDKLAQDTAKFIANTDPEFTKKQEIKVEIPKPILGGITVDNKKEDY